MANSFTLDAEQFRLLYENAPIGISITYDCNLLYANQAFAHLFGYDTPEELQGVSILEHITPPIQEEAAQRIFRRKNGEAVIGSYDVQCRRKDDSRFMIHIDLSQIPIPEGSAVVAFVTDITAQKEAEQRKEDFLSLVSHELRTPLTTVKAFTQILQKRFEKEERVDVVQYLSKMDMQINRITNLVLTLLDMSMMQKNTVSLSREPFDVNDVVAETVNHLQQITPKHQLLIEGECHCTINGDADRIGQAVTQLLLNAIKFSPNASTVIVRTSIDDAQDRVVISIQDFGVGVPKRHQRRIFERFYRVYEDKNTTYPGLGIGLYLAKEIITRHAGTLWVKSIEGQGATFSFSLPLHSSVHQDEGNHLA